MLHRYPKDLVEKLILLWQKPLPAKLRKTDIAHDLPDQAVLEDLVSTCYQVSLMKEEARGLRFRVMLCEPEVFLSEGFR